MRAINLKSALFHTLSGIFMLLACFYMLDFYKCLSGFIANGFRDGGTMLPMILSFLLPVVCFFVFIYDFYVRSLGKAARLTASALGGAYAATSLAFIFKNLDIYASNARIGVYDALPGAVARFPYDMIAVNLIILAVCAVSVAVAIRPQLKAAALLEGLKHGGLIRLCLAEYIPLCILAIVVFVFTGAGVTAVFTSLSNAAYDFRYVYLIVWTALVPMTNLLCLVLKPEKMSAPRTKRVAVLCAALGLNLIFGGLLAVFALTSPGFIIHTGKPLFTIAFSVSLPIEMAVILGIMAVGTLAIAFKLAMLLIKKAA